MVLFCWYILFYHTPPGGLRLICDTLDLCRTYESRRALLFFLLFSYISINPGIDINK